MNKLIKKALSNFDLYKFFDNEVRICTYNELTQYPTLEALFGDFNKVFILYETSNNFGHGS